MGEVIFWMLLRAAILVILCTAAYATGYATGARQERRRSNIRVRYVPMEVKWRETAPGSEPKLPDLSRWKRGGRR